MWRGAWLVVFAACWTKHPPPDYGFLDAPVSRADAKVADGSLDDPSCAGRVICPTGSHCEPECTQYGPPGCIYNCHTTCVPNDGCATVTTCAPPTVCTESCSNECTVMADICTLGCQSANGSCEQITNEADCKTAGCTPVYHASGCSCPDFGDCQCTNQMVSFARCQTQT